MPTVQIGYAAAWRRGRIVFVSFVRAALRSSASRWWKVVGDRVSPKEGKGRKKGKKKERDGDNPGIGEEEEEEEEGRREKKSKEAKVPIQMNPGRRTVAFPARCSVMASSC